jgi:hypothetical protein
MATFNKDRLSLVFQSIASPRTWNYWDTGVLIADVQEVEGFFTTGRDCGMRKGDRVFLTEGDTGAYNANDTSGRRQYGLTVVKAQDTGATQVTVGLGVLIGDTS